MKVLRATLPALGSYLIRFHDESREVVNYLGKKEFQRLANIDHLGMVSKVFTGVNHSRLEYTLLECAVVCLIKTLQRSDELFALAGKVKLSGQEAKISSGEELLKAWFLLSNSGHLQYTFTSEAMLLDLVNKHERIQKNLLARIADKDLKTWARHVIANRNVSKFYLVLACVRAGSLRKGDRRKKKLSILLKNLLLPEETFTDLSNDDLHKLNRLRRVFHYVRLLCIVTLDAYYSHHPIRFDIMSVIMNMSNLFDSEVGSFYPILERTAGWLADELYFHPTAIAVQRSYEFNASKINQGPRISRLSGEQFDLELDEILSHGFGEPEDALVSSFRHFCRLSFRSRSIQLGVGVNTYVEAVKIKKRVSGSKYVNISVKENIFSGTEHVDLLYDHRKVKPATIGMSCFGLMQWYSTRAEAEALSKIRRFSSLPARRRELIYAQRLRYLREQLRRDRAIMKSIFNSIIAYVLPARWKGVLCKFLPHSEDDYPVDYRFTYRKDGRYNSLSNQLSEVIRRNPHNYSDERLQELRAVDYVVEHSKSPFVIASLASYQVLDESNKPVDEWDGVVIEIGDRGVRVTIVEAKALSSAARNENEAFKQLGDTVKLVFRGDRRFKTKRRKIPGIGATLSLDLN